MHRTPIAVLALPLLLLSPVTLGQGGRSTSRPTAATRAPSYGVQRFVSSDGRAYVTVETAGDHFDGDVHWQLVQRAEQQPPLSRGWWPSERSVRTTTPGRRDRAAGVVPAGDRVLRSGTFGPRPGAPGQVFVLDEARGFVAVGGFGEWHLHGGMAALTIVLADPRSAVLRLELQDLFGPSEVERLPFPFGSESWLRDSWITPAGALILLPRGTPATAPRRVDCATGEVELLEVDFLEGLARAEDSAHRETALLVLTEAGLRTEEENVVTLRNEPSWFVRLAAFDQLRPDHDVRTSHSRHALSSSSAEPERFHWKEYREYVRQLLRGTDEDIDFALNVLHGQATTLFEKDDAWRRKGPNLLFNGFGPEEEELRRAMREGLARGILERDWEPQRQHDSLTHLSRISDASTIGTLVSITFRTPSEKLARRALKSIRAKTETPPEALIALFHMGNCAAQDDLRQYLKRHGVLER